MDGGSTGPKAGAAQGEVAARRPLAADPLPLVGFFTRLPVGTAAPLDAVVAAFPLVPVVGWATGAFGAVSVLLLAPVLPPAALAAVLLALVVGLTGLNQTDGLLDLGDGLMVHGDAENRLRVMHDHSAGVGAIGATLFTYLLSYGALAALLQTLAGEAEAAGGGPQWFTEVGFKAAAAVMSAEILCRLPYVLLAWLGRASHGGLGSAFVAGFGPRHALVGLAAAAPGIAAAAWLGWLPLVLALVAVASVAILLLRTAHRLLGGIGGDVMGASQELARAAVLLALCVGLGLQLSLQSVS
ncbi:MAG: adenosylcobinamide-GDP ribazoletransferase [Thermoleophilia bacterium]|nr:adenosylcobinamide-GDP ribazoletransferase [Thermoleophilia bacterium]